MSYLIVPDASELLMAYIFNLEIFSVATVRLFQNNYTPVAGTLVADFTEANFTGYTAEALTFNAPLTVGGKATLTNSGVMSFTMGTPGTGNTVYGYYVTIATPISTYGRLLYAERFDNPMVFANAGDQLNLTPVFTLFSEH